ncbi:RNA-binding protein 41-like [Centruroides vittatus]|uniref:RNA-binding protein 41-like n=1 Tax=Centruroides vittatus TaxID=120091 RepID=UPI00350F86FB
MDKINPGEVLSKNECKELGTETEAEKQLKSLLQKQLNTNVTLKQQFQQHRNFSPSGNYVPINETVSGVLSIHDFQSLEQEDYRVQELQKCGLTKEEINLYLNCTGKQRLKKSCNLNPDIQNERLDEIMKKIQERHEMLNKPTTFTGVKQLNRHEMDIEKTLYVGCQNKEQLRSLINSNESHSLEGPYKYILELSKKIEKYVKCKKRKRNHENCTNEFETTSQEDQKTVAVYEKPDPSVLHAAALLDVNTILENKLTIDEIKQLPKFSKYDAGKINKILYVKNLHPKTDIRELVSLFDRFTSNKGEPPSYRLLTGRMKGQAFVTFADPPLAQSALELINGYKLRGQPIIIEYGKKN